MTKKSRQKFKYLENDKSFYGEIKSVFHLFKRAFRCQKLSQTLEWAYKRVTWIYGWKPLTVSHHLAMRRGHWSSASGEIKCLICHVSSRNHVIKCLFCHLTSKNHVIKRSCNFTSGSSSLYVSIAQFGGQ